MHSYPKAVNEIMSITTQMIASINYFNTISRLG